MVSGLKAKTTENAAELLSLIHRIKGHKEPPYEKSDLYNMRDPWPKFGGIYAGIWMGWCWYRDDVILKQATKDDILFALQQFEDSAADAEATRRSNGSN